MAKKSKTSVKTKVGKAATSIRKKNKTVRTKSTDKFEMHNLNAEAFLRLQNNIWPIERDVFFRPDRMKYVRKIIKPKGCVFCNANKDESNLDSLCLFKSKYSMVILNKYPYNSGHLLVLPQRHCGDLLELSKDEWQDLSDLLRKAMQVVQDIYIPSGMNIGLNHGAAAGAGIPEHLHFHLVPRWIGDLNFFPLIADTKLVVEDLPTSYEKLRNAFSDKMEKMK